ncbi:ABC transporter [Propionibacterium freudenreichii subsp. freudenreichii]|nr:ABC transporter [Propionibacterium freudenreichii subsp. freudenreichii]CEG91044.1 ABC transporter [Propionibacterium freudenreichii]
MAGPLDPRLVKRATATRGFLVAVALVGVATAFLVLAQARLISDAVAHVFDTHNTDGVLAACGLLMAVFVARAGLNWLNQWLAHRASAAVKSQLRTDVMTARLARPTDASTPTGTLITLVTQGLDSLDGYFSKYLPQLMMAVGVPLVVGVAILTQDLESTIIIAITVPLIPLFMALIGMATQKQVDRRFAVETRLANHFADLVAGLPTLQVFGRARAQLVGLRRTEAAHRTETMKTLRLAFLSSFVLELLSTLSVALVAVSMGFRVVAGHFDLRTSLFVLILTPEVYLPIRQVGVHFHDSADGTAAADKAFELIEAAEATHIGGDAPAPDPAAATINFNDLSVRYPGTGRPALAGFSCRVRPGEVVVLRGTSGGGKSTALSVLMGFQPATSGQIRVGDQDLAEVNMADWRGHIAYVSQDPGMVNGTIADNVRMGHSDATDAQVRDALDRAGGRSLALSHVVADEGEGLSSGERRRVALARALLRIELGGARLLVLDEPTAGLDQSTEAIAIRAVRASGASALVVSHRPAVIAMADQVVDVVAPAAEPADGSDQRPDDSRATDSHTSGNARAAAAAVHALSSTAGEPSDVKQGTTPRGVSAPVGPAPGQAATSPSKLSKREARKQHRVWSTESGDSADFLLGEDQYPSSVLPHVAEARPDRPASAKGLEAESAPGQTSALVRQLIRGIPHGTRRLVTSIILAVCATGSSVGLMALSGWLLSRAAEHPPVLYLLAASVGVRFFGIGRGVFRYAERLVGHDLALRMEGSLRETVYAKLARTTLLGRHQGDLLVRVTADVDAVMDVVVRIVVPFVSSVLVIGLTSVLIAFFSPGAAVILLLTSLIAGIGLPWLGQRLSRRADEAAVPLRGALADEVRQLARCAPDLVAFGADGAQLDRMRATDIRLRDAEARDAWTRGIASAGQMLSSGLAVVGGLLVGGPSVAGGQLLGRDLAILVLTPLALHESLSDLTTAAQTMTRARAALRRVIALLREPPVGKGDRSVPEATGAPQATGTPQTGAPSTRADVPQPAVPSAGGAVAGAGTPPGELVLSNLAAGWPGHGAVIKGVNLRVGPGERVAITGASGVGKTTLAATVMGLIDPIAGTVQSPAAIGYLAQDAHIFATSVAENVRIGDKDATDAQVAQALSKAGLATMDPARVVGEEGATLSGGEARRIAMARILVGGRNDQLVILDEPTEHLDSETAEALMDDVWSAVDKAAVVVITHDPELMEAAPSRLDLDDYRA